MRRDTEQGYMIHPTIHLNGTSKEALEEGYADALQALAVAIRAVESTAPNMRDYYVQGPEAFPQASAEHRARVERLTAVRQELTDLWGAL